MLFRSLALVLFHAKRLPGIVRSLFISPFMMPPVVAGMMWLVILDPSLEERTVAPSLDQYLNVIRTAGGSVEKLDVWGRRRLAFEINKKAEGIYAVVDLQATPEAVAELDRQLRLNESILRTKVIRPETR